ncbi:ribonuclease HII [Candidatus Woesearchaeota archaeon]|nr:ribonuclease HII [Candidatus Woesearchaeota archaeon]
MPTVCGIDEAGRGPIIGSLHICGVVIEAGQEGALKALGVKDSKLLTPKKREQLYDQVKKLVKAHKVIRIPPDEIDDAVQSKDGLNLNWLEANKAVELIDALKPDSTILDCPSPNLKAYSQFIEKKLVHKTALTCAHHADTDYVVVGAASILAKVERDREIAELRKKLGVDFGSGYISDPKTKAFVESYWDKFPEIFRHSWKTFKNASQQSLGKYD